jgi:O-antigen/teichoic acid export membrane protein
MRFILNRSIIVSLITYAGVIIGYVNLLWLFPKVMSLEQIGLFRTLQDIALLFVPFAQLGAGQGLLRFFPYGANRQEQKQLLSLALLWSLASFLLFLLLFWLLQDWIIQFFEDKAAAVNAYLPVVLLLTFILNFQGILEPLSRSLLKFRFVAFSREILLRLLTALLVVAYFMGLLSFHQAVWGLVGVYGTVSLLIGLSLARGGWASLSLTLSPAIRGMIRPFAFYGLTTFLASASSLLIMKTDSVMVTQMLGLDANAIYTTVFFMAVIIELPRRIISQISTPLLSQAFERNDMQLAGRIYHKTALNLLLVGALLYVGIICNLPALFSLMPQGEAFRTGLWVVVIIGLGKLIDGAAGVNGEMLSMSAHYRINLYLIILMAIMNVVLNWLLIPLWGIEGAAIASCLSLMLFNLLKWAYIRFQLKLDPFTPKTLLLLAISLLALAAGWFMPRLPLLLLDVGVRSLLITLIFAGGVLFFRVSEEATELYEKLLAMLRRRS